MWRVVVITLALLFQRCISEKSADEHLKNGIGMAMQLCNKKCNCSVVQKTISCKSIKGFLGLANAGSKYIEEFAGFVVSVSDDNLKFIDNKSFALKSERSNGLAKIKGLTLKSMKKLKKIQPDFFEKYFPSLEYLTGIECFGFEIMVYWGVCFLATDWKYSNLEF